MKKAEPHHEALNTTVPSADANHPANFFSAVTQAGSLDDLFKKTSADPPLYYLPLSDEAAKAKLAAREASHKAEHR